MKRQIFLYSSEIASYIGQNKWDFVTPFERLWKRCDKLAYTEIISKYSNNIKDKRIEMDVIETKKVDVEQDLNDKKITKRQRDLRIKKLEKSKEIIQKEVEEMEERVMQIDSSQQKRLEQLIGKDVMDNVQSDLKENKVEVNDKKMDVTSLIDRLNISDDKKAMVKQEAVSFINKAHGTFKEDTAITMFENQFGVKLDTSQEFYKKHLTEISKNSEFDWYIGGKLDGIYKHESDSSKDYIVEIKNRTRSFFNTLRDYEKTQIHLYMYMLDIPAAKLVEKYNDKIRITHIFENKEYTNDVVTNLGIFIQAFEREFLAKTELKNAFVSKTPDEKKILLRRLYLNKIWETESSKITSQLQDNDADCLIDDLD